MHARALVQELLLKVFTFSHFHSLHKLDLSLQPWTRGRTSELLNLLRKREQLLSVTPRARQLANSLGRLHADWYATTHRQLIGNSRFFSLSTTKDCYVGSVSLCIIHDLSFSSATQRAAFSESRRNGRRNAPNDNADCAQVNQHLVYWSAMRAQRIRLRGLLPLLVALYSSSLASKTPTLHRGSLN